MKVGEIRLWFPDKLAVQSAFKQNLGLRLHERRGQGNGSRFSGDRRMKLP